MSATPPAADHAEAAQFRNLRVFQAGQALSNIGTFSQVVALSLLVRSRLPGRATVDDPGESPSRPRQQPG